VFFGEGGCSGYSCWSTCLSNCCCCCCWLLLLQALCNSLQSEQAHSSRLQDEVTQLRRDKAAMQAELDKREVSDVGRGRSCYRRRGKAWIGGNL
jgi:hypothetical protein